MLSQIEKQKIQALKLAPWWKRLLSYIIDSVILFIILIFFISGIYGNEFTILLDSISQVGGLSLLSEDTSVPSDAISQIATLSSHEQNVAYWLYIIQNKYTKSIFIINQIISSVYFILFWWSTGQTLGARILKIKVVPIPIYEKISLLSAISRTAALKLIEMAWGLPALIITNPMLKQRLQDSLSKTLVVEDVIPDLDKEDLYEDLENTDSSLNIPKDQIDPE